MMASSDQFTMQAEALPKEALAVVWACERFHVYLYRKHFELETDHKPLEVIYSSKSRPSARIERWVLRLQPYEFTVKYRPGPQNVADALSRLTQDRLTENEHVAEEYIRYVAENAAPSLAIQEIEGASKTRKLPCYKSVFKPMTGLLRNQFTEL